MKRDAPARETERHRQELERVKVEAVKKELVARLRLAAEVIGEEELAALQSRLQAMHEAKLLTDDESGVRVDLAVKHVHCARTMAPQLTLPAPVYLPYRPASFPPPPPWRKDIRCDSKTTSSSLPPPTSSPPLPSPASGTAPCPRRGCKRARGSQTLLLLRSS